MSLFKPPSSPGWRKDRLELMARRTGHSVQSLREDIARNARIAAEPGHLPFDTLRSQKLTPQQQEHIDGCDFCQRLHESIHEVPSDVLIEALLNSEGDANGRSRLRGGASVSARVGDLLSRFPRWDVVAAAAAALLVVGTGGYEFGKARTANSAILESLPVEAQLAVAQEQVLKGDIRVANEVLLSAFNKSGLDKNTLASVTTALNSSAAAPNGVASTAPPEARRWLMVTHEKVKEGDWTAGYKALGQYLAAAEGGAPVVDAYEKKFIDGLVVESDGEREEKSEGAARAVRPSAHP